MLRRTLRVALSVASISAGLLAGPGAAPASAEPAYKVPAQFISKIYTESLGIAPPTTQWANIQNYYLSTPCSAANLGTWVKEIYKSADFNFIYPIPDPTANKHVYSARVIALFRGALNREPDVNEFNANRNYLVQATQTQAGVQAVWNNVVDNIVGSAAFTSLATAGICKTDAAAAVTDPANYGWNTLQIEPFAVPYSTECGLAGGITRQTLQNALNNAPAGGTVKLAQSALVYLDAQLVVPAGKTLTTCGPSDSANLPDPVRNRYALQARLVRTWNRSATPNTTWPYSPTSSTPITSVATVKLETGAKIDKVWVDGNRNKSQNNCYYSVSALDRTCSNVVIVNWLCPGQGPNDAPNCPVNTSVTNSRLDNAAGGTTLASYGAGAGAVCRGDNYVTNNLITGYQSAHSMDAWNRGQWTDGMTIGCEKTQIMDNHVIDMTDVPIIVWRSCVPTETFCHTTYVDNRQQKSKVERNTVIAAGNSNWGSIWHTTGESTIQGSPVADFTGSTIKDNHIFTSVAATTHALVVLGARTIGHTVAGVSHPDWTTRAFGAVVTNNDTSGQIAYVNVGVIASGMRDLYLAGNHFDLTRVAFAGVGGLPTSFPGWRCGAGWLTNNQRAPIIAEVSSDQGVYYWANGVLGPNDSTTTLDMGATSFVGGVETGCMRLDV